MNRRGFLSSLAAIAAGATLDPERLLWKPGAKLISIPHGRLTLWPLPPGYLEALQRRWRETSPIYAVLERERQRDIEFAVSPRARLAPNKGCLSHHPASSSDQSGGM